MQILLIDHIFQSFNIESLLVAGKSLNMEADVGDLVYRDGNNLVKTINHAASSSYILLQNRPSLLPLESKFPTLHTKSRK